MENLELNAIENFLLYQKCEEIIKQANNREIVFLCLGNPKLWFDCFGPIVGSILRELGLKKYIYGNIKSPIVGSNLSEYVNMIYKFHINPYIVVIDTVLSKNQNILLKINQGPLECAVFSSNCQKIGDVSITCGVNNKNDRDILKNYKNILLNVKKITRMIYYVFGINEKCEKLSS